MERLSLSVYEDWIRWLVKIRSSWVADLKVGMRQVKKLESVDGLVIYETAPPPCWNEKLKYSMDYVTQPTGSTYILLGVKVRVSFGEMSPRQARADFPTFVSTRETSMVLTTYILVTPHHGF